MDFINDDKTSSAVIKKFEIIGEATKNVLDGIRKKYPDIPRKEMAGLRDKLVHFYFGIKHEIVWDTIKIMRNKNLYPIFYDRKKLGII